MDFLNGLIGALSSVGNLIEQIFVILFNIIVQVFTFIWNVIVYVANFLAGVIKAIANFFAHLWQSFFKGIFTKLWHGIVNAWRWLEQHLRPIINFLRRVQRYIDTIYRHYVMPFLRILQIIRGYLNVLKLLHIRWAARLDNILSTVQRDVQGVFLQIRGILNTVIDLLNIVADPHRLLRRPTLILSVRRTINALIRQLTGLPPGFFIPSRHPAGKGTGFLPSNFNPADPLQNPPASYYLGLVDDVPSFGDLGPGEFIQDEDIDGFGPLDFFDMQQADTIPCADAVQCLADAARSGAKGQ